MLKQITLATLALTFAGSAQAIASQAPTAKTILCGAQEGLVTIDLKGFIDPSSPINDGLFALITFGGGEQTPPIGVANVEMVESKDGTFRIGDSEYTDQATLFLQDSVTQQSAQFVKVGGQRINLDCKDISQFFQQ